MTKKYLNRKEILSIPDQVVEEVHIIVWNTHVRVRSLTGLERDAFEATVVNTNGKNTKVNMRNARAKLVAMAVVDENGEQLFVEDDVVALGNKNASALQAIFDVASRLAGIGDDEIEELSKNSIPGQSAGPGSD